MFLTNFFAKNRVIIWNSVNSCMFLTLRVWVRNIQEFTDYLVTLPLNQFETKPIPVYFCKILWFTEVYRNSRLFNFFTILKLSEFLYVSWLYTKGKKHTGIDWVCEISWIPVWLLHISGMCVTSKVYHKCTLMMDKMSTKNFEIFNVFYVQ